MSLKSKQKAERTVPYAVTALEARKMLGLSDLAQGSEALPRVAVAMSGGVDSCVVACLAKLAGFEVIGLTLQLYDSGRRLESGSKTCCAGIDIRDAKRVAAQHGFRHYTLNYESQFSQKVVSRFADAYLRGETPVPCILCNQKVKFEDLLVQARAIGACALLTGHYVIRRQDRDGAVSLYVGADEDRDQSYFLFTTTADQARYLRFPLGGLSKEETRSLAAFFELSVQTKPASQDICFVPNRDYRAVVRRLRPEAGQPGRIVSQSGQVLGTHAGIASYTVGQRRGLSLGASGLRGESHRQPVYVTGIDAARNEVIVGSRADLAVGAVDLRDINFLASRSEVVTDEAATLEVKFRSRMRSVPARLDAAHGRVIFSEPQFGVSPGQACVFYRSGKLLGGGWIQRTHKPLSEVFFSEGVADSRFTKDAKNTKNADSHTEPSLI